MANPRKGVVATSFVPYATKRMAASWYYDYWGKQRFPGAVGWVPMVWGSVYEPLMLKQTAAALPGSYWLIFNEPDRYDQANLTPEEAAAAFYNIRRIILKVDAAPKFIVGGVSNIEGGGFDWLKNFWLAYKRAYGIRPDIAGFHFHYYWAWPDFTPEAWVAKLQLFRQTCKGFNANWKTMQYWMTEFGCLSNGIWATQVMNCAMRYVNTLPWLTRYAWYATESPWCGSLMTTTSAPSDLGWVYRLQY